MVSAVKLRTDFSCLALRRFAKKSRDGNQPEVAARWPGTDLRAAAVAALTDLPVALLKDTAAA